MGIDRWKVCPECGSDNIHCDFGVNAKATFYREGNTIFLNRFGKRAMVDLFVCVDCGNIRSFVSSDEVLRHIRDAWPRADSVMPGGDEEVRRLVKQIEGGEEME
jgi:hypothetical protein